MHRGFNPSCACGAIRLFLQACVSAVLLVACNGGTSTSPIAGMPGPEGGALQVQSAAAVDLTLPAGAAPGKLKNYVANFGVPGQGPWSVTTYTKRGTERKPTITQGLSGPTGVAVDASGKIYVANSNSQNVTTYTSKGKPTKPTITTPQFPNGLAVDANGKTYVVSCGNSSGCGNGTLTTYEPDGTPTSRTITGLDYPNGVAVDAAGKIYVTNLEGGRRGSGYVSTYEPDGTRTTPTIVSGIDKAYGVAVDANGKIYVTNLNNTLTTYKSNGRPTIPTIAAGLSYPVGVAVAADGKIYVANYDNCPSGISCNNGYVTTYRADGMQTTPTITTGIYLPLAMALH